MFLADAYSKALLVAHKYEIARFPGGEHHIEQHCLLCGERRIAYRSGSKAYFSKDSGSKMPFPTACLTNKHVIENARVVSIGRFVKGDQIEQIDIGKFIEAIFILKSIQQDGLTERTGNMIDAFLDTQEHKELKIAL